MDEITVLIKSEIKRQYKSIRQFSQKSGIPYSTLSNALTKGIGCTSYNTVIKIFNLLDLKQSYAGAVYQDIIGKLSALDELAIQMVKQVIKAEYDRCTRDRNYDEGSLTA